MSARAILCAMAVLTAAVPALAAPAWAEGKTEYCYTTLQSDAELKAGKVNSISCYSSELQLTAAVAVSTSRAPGGTTASVPPCTGPAERFSTTPKSTLAAAHNSPALAAEAGVF